LTINAFEDTLLTMTEAAKECPKIEGKRLSSVTLWRWAKHGKRGVKLEHVWIGRNMMTTKGAMNAFFHAVASAPAREKTTLSECAPKATANQREREIESARKRLIARGMLPKETEH
jgi:hypothetical protein